MLVCFAKDGAKVIEKTETTKFSPPVLVSGLKNRFFVQKIAQNLHIRKKSITFAVGNGTIMSRELKIQEFDDKQVRIVWDDEEQKGQVS